jgi:hypothetical protein
MRPTCTVERNVHAIPSMNSRSGLAIPLYAEWMREDMTFSRHVCFNEGEVACRDDEGSDTKRNLEQKGYSELNVRVLKRSLRGV